jgi:putative flavoprotein involved in K+ transport
MSSEERFNTIVIGAGQAGLAAGYYLNKQRDDFIILDENDQIGNTWRKRWDSLRLFTPSQNNNLPGMKFPKPDFYFPTKDEVADYLNTYARQFGLPVRSGVKVESLQHNEAGYRLTMGSTNLHARNVIVATGPFRTPYIPAIAQALSPNIFQMHSMDYHNPSDIKAEYVLVVGAGNSGVEIAVELAKAGRKTWLAGRDVGRIPADKLGRVFRGRPYWWFIRRVMTIHTPLGRRMKARITNHGDPLIRARRDEVYGAGVEILPRLAHSGDEVPITEDGRAVAADGIVWATGFKPDYQWIKLPIFNGGYPRHERGLVPQAPGIFFLGLRFQSGLTSSLLGGVGEDAKFITGKIHR